MSVFFFLGGGNRFYFLLLKNTRDKTERLLIVKFLVTLNTLRTGLLNCLNARSRSLNFRHRASCIQGQAFRYSPENAFYIVNQQIYKKALSGE